MQLVSLIAILAALSLAASPGGAAGPPEVAPPAGAAAATVLSASITGPGTIPLGVTCEFYGVPNGGTAPYVFSWSNNSGGTGWADDFSTYSRYYFGAYGEFVLTFTVTDALGRTATATKTVRTYPNAPMCDP